MGETSHNTADRRRSAILVCYSSPSTKRSKRPTVYIGIRARCRRRFPPILRIPCPVSKCFPAPARRIRCPQAQGIWRKPLTQLCQSGRNRRRDTRSGKICLRNSLRQGFVLAMSVDDVSRACGPPLLGLDPANEYWQHALQNVRPDDDRLVRTGHKGELEARTTCTGAHQRLPQRLNRQPRPRMRRRMNSSTIAPRNALTIWATIPTPRWMFSRGNSQSPTSAPNKPTIKSPTSPKPEPSITRPASQPAMSPTKRMTRRLSFDRCMACSSKTSEVTGANPPRREQTCQMLSVPDETSLFLDVLCHAPHRGFCGVEIAGCIDGNPFSHGAVGRIGLVRRHEHRHLAVLQAADANAPKPAWVHSRRRLGVGHINRVARVDCEPARAAELAIFADILPVLGQDLYAMVVAVGDDEPALGVELNGVRRPELAWARSGLADDPQELAVPVEHRDTADKIGLRDVRVTLGHVNVAVGRVGDDVGRLGQGFRRISRHARLAQRHQDLTFGTELDDHASLRLLSGKLRKRVGARHTCVGHPHVAVSVDMNAMRPHEHAAAKAPDLLA